MTVGHGRTRTYSSIAPPASALSPSASTTSGTSIRSTSSRASSCAPLFLLMPGPITTASARPIASSAGCNAVGTSTPLRSGRPTIIASSSLTVNESSRDWGAPTVT